MFVAKKAISRRTLLRGMGTAVALPFLDAMAPALAQAPKAPTRMAFVYVPNGMDMRNWILDYEGPLGRAVAHPEAPGAFEARHHDPQQPDAQHRARAAGWPGRSWPLLRLLSDRRAGEEDVDRYHGQRFLDQVVANKIGGATRFPSLELGLEDARQAGDCDSGYSCAYTNNLAWQSDTQPLPPVLDPRAIV